MAPRAQSADLIFVRRSLILIGIGAFVLLLWTLQGVLLLVFAAVLIAIILRALAEPIARYLRLAPPWALTLASLLIVGFIGGVFWLFGSEVVFQSRELARILPEAWQSFTDRFGLAGLDQRVREGADSPDSALIFSVAGWVFSVGAVIVNVVLVVVGGLYIAAAPRLYTSGLELLFPESKRALVEDTMETSGRALRLWLLGQLAAMALVGLLTAIGLWVIGMPAPLALGLLAALAEFVPLVGPIAAALPALLLAVGGGWEMVAWTIGLYLLVQQIESNVITPLVQHRTVEIPPALTLFAVLAAGVAFGPLGVILAAPLTVLGFVIVKKLYVRETLGEKVPVPGDGSTAKTSKAEAKA